MYIVSKDGRKFSIDTSKLREDDIWNWPFKKGLVAVCNDDEYMKKVWIVSVQKNKNDPLTNKELDLEILSELEYDHEPTQEDLLYIHNAYGEGSYNTYIFINEVYKHDYKEKD